MASGVNKHHRLMSAGLQGPKSGYLLSLAAAQPLVPDLATCDSLALRDVGRVTLSASPYREMLCMLFPGGLCAQPLNFANVSFNSSATLQSPMASPKQRTAVTFLTLLAVRPLSPFFFDSIAPSFTNLS
jgi:hypothetical protein